MSIKTQKSIFLILTVLLILLYSCNDNNKNSKDKNSKFIDLADYHISKQVVESLDSLDFSKAIITPELHFFPTEEYFNQKSKYNNVQKVTIHKKAHHNSFKQYDRTLIFNKNGFLSEMIGRDGVTTKYQYDNNDNLIQEMVSSNQDTIFLKTIEYNQDNKITTMKKWSSTEENSREYDLDIEIEYNLDGSPKNIIYNDTKDPHSKRYLYEGNTVIAISNSKVYGASKKILTYSKKFELLKQEASLSTTFYSKLDSNNATKTMTYYGEYCCTDYYEHDSLGNVVKRIFTNHLKDHKEIHTYEYKLDSLGNVTYKYSSDNLTENEYETFYDFVYFDK